LLVGEVAILAGGWGMDFELRELDSPLTVPTPCFI
jgi:hypothetical protein